MPFLRAAVGLPATVDRDLLRGRTMLVRQAEVIPFECVVRGWLAGSGLAEYRRNGTVCGVRLPAGLGPGSPLPEPIFTPATKAVTGHDENVSFEVMADRLANEYQLEVIFEAAPFAEARWVNGSRADLEDFAGKHRNAMAEDIDAQPVFLAKSSWEIGYVTEKFPTVTFQRTRERG